MSSTYQPANGASLKGIATLAILKVNWDERRDYIGNFVPLVAHCLRESGAKAASVPELQESVLTTFGLRIPQGALQTILHRAAREGLVSRSHSIYQPTERLTEVNLNPARDSVLRQHHHLVQRLIEFAADNGRDWSEEKAEQALLGYVETLAAPILGVVVDGDPVVDLPAAETDGSALVSRFVLQLVSQEPQAFEYLETVVKGSMLANILYFPKAFTSGKPRLTGMLVYLDTPVALRVVGYAEEHYRAPAMEMVELLEAQGAKFNIFDHTLREIEGVLDGAAENYRRGRPGEVPGDVVDFFASQELTASDVEAMIATLNSRLAQHSIDVVAAPAQTEALAVDETTLEHQLSQQVGYRRREALLRDLDSLTGIHRIRDGQPRRRIERSEAILVTSNYPLCRVAQGFFKDAQGRAGFPLCMLDSRLVSLAWLMNPVQGADLPRKQIIATSYAALNPPESVWRRYLAEVRRLAEHGDLTDDQVVLLLFSPEARFALLDSTDGDPTTFTEGTVAQVLEHARAAARSEVKAELDDERRHRQQADERREAAERAMAAEQARAAQAVAQIAAVTHAHATRVKDLSRMAARIIGWAAYSLVFALVVAGAGFATTGLFPESWSQAVPFVSWFVITMFVLVGLAGMAWGFSLHSIVDGAEKLLHQRIERRISGVLSPPDQQDATRDQQP